MIELATTWLTGAVVIAAALLLERSTDDRSDSATSKQPDLEAIDLEDVDDDLADLLEEHGRDQ